MRNKTNNSKPAASRNAISRSARNRSSIEIVFRVTGATRPADKLLDNPVRARCRASGLWCRTVPLRLPVPRVHDGEPDPHPCERSSHLERVKPCLRRIRHYTISAPMQTSRIRFDSRVAKKYFPCDFVAFLAVLCVQTSRNCRHRDRIGRASRSCARSGACIPNLAPK